MYTKTLSKCFFFKLFCDYGRRCNKEEEEDVTWKTWHWKLHWYGLLLSFFLVLARMIKITDLNVNETNNVSTEHEHILL